MLKEGLRGAAVPKAQAHHPQGTGCPAQVVVGAQGGRVGGSSPQGPGTPAWGDGESYPGGGRCSRRACGPAVPKAQAHHPQGTGSPAQVVVGAQGGHAGGQQSPRPRHSRLGGHRTLPRRRPVPGGCRQGAIVCSGACSRSRGHEALPSWRPLLRHALTGRPYPLRRRAIPPVEPRAGSSRQKTVLTPRLCELYDGVALRPYPAMLSRQAGEVGRQYRRS